MSEKINKISLSSNDDKRLQSTDSVETYGYRTSKSLSRIKEKNKCKNNKNNTKMINFDHITKESIKERNPNWPKTSDHPYIILRIRSSGSPSLPPHPPPSPKRKQVKKQILIKFIHMLRIQMRQNISCLLKNVKIQVYSISRILNLLLNIQMIWMIFIKLLWNTIQIKNTRY